MIFMANLCRRQQYSASSRKVADGFVRFEPTSEFLYRCMAFLCVLAVLTVLMFYLDAGLLASSQYPEGPALAGHLDTGFSWFPCV
jgi:hypothetical protein